MCVVSGWSLQFTAKLFTRYHLVVIRFISALSIYEHSFESLSLSSYVRRVAQQKSTVVYFCFVSYLNNGALDLQKSNPHKSWCIMMVNTKMFKIPCPETENDRNKKMQLNINAVKSFNKKNKTPNFECKDVSSKSKAIILTNSLDSIWRGFEWIAGTFCLCH